MYVNECMRTNVITTTGDTSIYRAQKQMLENRIHRLPVVDEKGKLIGMLTDRKLRMMIVSLFSSMNKGEVRKPPANVKVTDVMVKDVITISPDAPASQAAYIGRKRGIGALPVVDDDGMVVGIITTTDLIRVLQEMLHLERPGAHLRFSGGVKQEKLPEVIRIIHKHHGQVKTVHCLPSSDERKEKFDIYIYVDEIDPIEKELNNLGYSVSVKSHSDL